MKKFYFSLDTVLSYKQQVLDGARGEYATAMDAVHRQEAHIEQLWRNYRAYNDEFRQRSSMGLAITDALMYETGLRASERNIQRETDALARLQEEAERKRQEMVEARKETASLESLREHKLDEYQKAVQKSEEALIEELVMRNHRMEALT